MKVYLLDTNCLLRFFLHDIQEQYQKTKEIILQAKKGKVKLVVPGVVIPELIYSLEKFYARSRETTAETILSLVTASYIEVENKDVYRSALNLYKTENFDFVDCYLICKARVEEAELFTLIKNYKNSTKLISNSLK